ncbi:MAG: zeta toxin family protein [Gammaproteobacteria bacterium]|nr:zeta toxin family protein [Gammaproteobacteria bacterium]
MSAADDESALRQRADDFARANAKQIAADFLADFNSAENPVSAFMAGSPGAGKTEFSKRFVQGAGNVARIDADELRDCFTVCGYDGANSHLFQKAATRLVHAIHDLALKRQVSFLMDGTFAGEKMARQNIQRSLKRGRGVFVIFVYQSPQAAWDFVQRREAVEGRRIRPGDFAQKFCASQAVVNKMKAEFGGDITLSLVVKDLDNAANRFYRKSIERVDDHLPERHDERGIRKLIETQPSADDNGAL